MKKIALITVLIIFFSCTNDDSDSVACTEEFRTIVVTIKDKTGNPLALDKFMVTVIDSGIDITREISNSEYELMKESGIYPLFGDEYSDTYANKTTRINFSGFVNNEKVANADFTVGADRCHVKLIDGNTNIVVD
jgi:hypothetical protein